MLRTAQNVCQFMKPLDVKKTETTTKRLVTFQYENINYKISSLK